MDGQGAVAVIGLTSNCCVCFGFVKLCGNFLHFIK